MPCHISCRLTILVILIITRCVLSVPIPESCRRNPRSCVAPALAAAIDRLRALLELDDKRQEGEDPVDPFRCLLFERNTVPRGKQCVSCEHPVFGCRIPHNRGAQWDEVCGLFCTPSAPTEAPSAPPAVVPIESESEKTKKGRPDGGENRVSPNPEARVQVNPSPFPPPPPPGEGRQPPPAEGKGQQRPHQKPSAVPSGEHRWPLSFDLFFLFLLIVGLLIVALVLSCYCSKNYNGKQWQLMYR